MGPGVSRFSRDEVPTNLRVGGVFSWVRCPRVSAPIRVVGIGEGPTKTRNRSGPARRAGRRRRINLRRRGRFSRVAGVAQGRSASAAGGSPMRREAAASCAASRCHRLGISGSRRAAPSCVPQGRETSRAGLGRWPSCSRRGCLGRGAVDGRAAQRAGSGDVTKWHSAGAAAAARSAGATRWPPGGHSVGGRHAAAEPPAPAGTATGPVRRSRGEPVLSAGHEARWGLARGGRVAFEAGFGSHGRSRRAARRCYRPWWQRWIQAGSFGSRGWRPQRFSAVDAGAKRPASGHYRRIEIPGAHVRRRRLFTSTGSIAATGKEWRRRRTILIAGLLLSTGRLDIHETIYLCGSRNCFRRIYVRPVRISAAVRGKGLSRYLGTAFCGLRRNGNCRIGVSSGRLRAGFRPLQRLQKPRSLCFGVPVGHGAVVLAARRPLCCPLPAHADLQPSKSHLYCDYNAAVLTDESHYKGGIAVHQ